MIDSPAVATQRDLPIRQAVSSGEKLVGSTGLYRVPHQQQVRHR